MVSSTFTQEQNTHGQASKTDSWEFVPSLAGISHIIVQTSNGPETLSSDQLAKINDGSLEKPTWLNDDVLQGINNDISKNELNMAKGDFTAKVDTTVCPI